MKKLIFAAALILGCFSVKFADAQLKINLNLNIGSQPDWGPTGYDHAEYYYFPDIDAYYYVPNHQYIYYQNNAWVRTTALPARYRNFNVYNSYKVVLNQPEPWKNASAIRAKYSNYKGHRGQSIIRDSRDNKYRNHWSGDSRRDNDRGRNDHGRPHNSSHGHH